MEILRHIRHYALAGLCISAAFYAPFILPLIDYKPGEIWSMGSYVLHPGAIYPVMAIKAYGKDFNYAPDMALAFFSSSAVCVLFYTSAGLATCRRLREYRLFFALLALSLHGPWWIKIFFSLCCGRVPGGLL